MALLKSMLLIAVVVPALFWVKAGPASLPVAGGFTVFLLVLVALPFVIERLRPPPAKPAGAPPEASSPLDTIAAGVWLLSSTFGVGLGWALTQWLPLTAGSWQILLGTRVFLGFALPVVSLVWMLRSIRGPLPVLLVFLGLTALPVASTLGSLVDLLQGPTPEAHPRLRGVGARAPGIEVEEKQRGEEGEAAYRGSADTSPVGLPRPPPWPSPAPAPPARPPSAHDPRAPPGGPSAGPTASPPPTTDPPPRGPPSHRRSHQPWAHLVANRPKHTRRTDRTRAPTRGLSLRRTDRKSLGLAIARAAVEAHGGRVRFVDLGPPRVKVRVELPR